ncbi:MAG: NAD(P)-binding protein, partial [Tannerella sp.]|nr:NAD(P)-binding protein [Tannerella sp.]
MTKKILIIGGGVAGLSTGIYARMSGYETRIVEMGQTVGGICTSWYR